MHFIIGLAMAEDDVPLISAVYSANEGSDGGSPTVTGLFRPEDSVNEPSMDFSSMNGQNGSKSLKKLPVNCKL